MPSSRSTVVITGASSGIGAEFARKLAPEHDLILIARRKGRLEEAQRLLSEKYGARIDVIPADLTRDDDLNAVAARVRDEPRLILLINNAGFGTRGRFWEASIESQDAMHKLHVLATMQLSHAALANLIPRDVGGIINVSSVAAFIRRSGSASYGATKAWIATFTEALYVELRGIQSRVTVQALCPGFTHTEFHLAMGVSAQSAAPGPFWMSAGQVVDASLEGLRRRKLFVIPGWRYRLIVSVLTKLPSSVRVGLESGLGVRSRARSLASEEQGNRIGAGK